MHFGMVSRISPCQQHLEQPLWQRRENCFLPRRNPVDQEESRNERKHEMLWVRNADLCYVNAMTSGQSLRNLVKLVGFQFGKHQFSRRCHSGYPRCCWHGEILETIPKCIGAGDTWIQKEFYHARAHEIDMSGRAPVHMLKIRTHGPKRFTTRRC